MSDTPVVLTRQVVERAGNRCEYCGLSQLGQEATFHIDHVIPRAADGPIDYVRLRTDADLAAYLQKRLGK
jgi:hypothetical protein